MRNIKFIAFAVIAVLSAAACTKDINSERLIITAEAGTIDGSATGSKATGAYGYQVLWDEGDKIAVTDGNKVGQFRLIEGVGETIGRFKQESGPDLAGEVTAYYPASLLQDGSVVWPTDQKYSASLTGVPMSTTATVSPSGTYFSFQSLGGVLQLVLTSNEGEILMKSITVSADNLDSPVTLDCRGAIIGTTAMNFAIALPAASYSNMQLRFETISGTVSTMKSSSLEIKKGVVSKVTLALAGFTESFPNYLSFTAIGVDVPVSLHRSGSPDSIPLEYSFDPVSDVWHPFTADGAGPSTQGITNIPEGQTLYLRATSVRTNFSKSSNDYWNFYFGYQSLLGGYIAAKGNIMSLLDPELKSQKVGNYAFYYMFSSLKELVSAPDLPAVELGSYCYSNMFAGCSNLTEAPVLPATKLPDNCYREMFSRSGLKSSAEMYAATLSEACCASMYNECASLVTAKPLPATELAASCYFGMFQGCSSLRKAPALPATTLKEKCYDDMFYKCTSLLEAPYLPATTLSDYCYKGMFRECSSLETAPDLPATSLVEGCYDYIFNNCKSLKSLRVGFTSWPEHYTFYWLHNVSPTGDFYCPASLSSVYGDNRIPTGWTIHHTSVPDVTEIGTLVNVDGIEAMYVGKVGKVGKLVIMTNNLGADDKNIVGNAYSLDDLQELKKSKAFKDGWRLPTEEEMNFLAKNSKLMGFGSTVCTFGEGNLYFHYTQDVEGGKRESRHWLADEQSCFWFRSDNKYGRTTTEHTAVDEFYVRLVKVFQ